MTYCYTHRSVHCSTLLREVDIPVVDDKTESNNGQVMRDFGAHPERDAFIKLLPRGSGIYVEEKAETL